MASSSASNPNKRKLTAEPVSPPPSRRKIQSSTTQNAVSSFFTKSSQKPPQKITWHERGPHEDSASTLIVGKYEPSDGSSHNTIEKRFKVAAFDFDSTLIQTASGKKFASNAEDWKWWHLSVPGILRKLYNEDGFRVIVLSNQGGISLSPDTKGPKTHVTKFVVFKTKVAAVFNQLDIPISIYAATGKDIFRKPRTGMWTELLDDYNITASDIDLENSIFVGDAGGRVAGEGKLKDFSCSDRNFATNVGINFYTPEEYFLKEAPRPFVQPLDPKQYIVSAVEDHLGKGIFTKLNEQEIVILCGSPGAGKSTFYKKYLAPLRFIRVNQDTLKTRDRCLKVATENLVEGKSVAIDNTNADIEVRSKWVELAKKHSVPIRCVWLTTDAAVCQHNDIVRALNNVMNPEKRDILPSMAFSSYRSRFQPPKISEGFTDITQIDFKFEGNQIERDIWARHWT